MFRKFWLGKLSDGLWCVTSPAGYNKLFADWYDALLFLNAAIAKGNHTIRIDWPSAQHEGKHV